MESQEELNGRSKGTVSPDSIGFTKGTLNRNASFDMAQGAHRKTHVRTGSDYQKPDFWARVADQTSYIDSTRSSLLVDQVTNQPKGCSANYACSNSTPALPLPALGGRSFLHRFSVREPRRGKMTRFYSSDHSTVTESRGELRVHQPLLYDGSRTSLAAIWAAVDNNRLKKPYTCRKPSSWEESVSMERRRSLAAREVARPSLTGALPSPIMPDFPIPTASLIGMDSKDLRYCFQHPYLRLFTTLTIIFCNFLLFAEDPISHSRTEAVIPLVGNVFSFVCTKYPPDWRWALIKVFMWMFAIVCGLTMGKIFIHALIFGKYLRLKMFRDEQGSWIAMFLTVILSLYLFSHVYNFLLQYFYPRLSYKINSAMGLTNSTVMKAAACGTWLGDLVTWLMVTDVMLQDSLYPEWAPGLRAIWKATNVPRILIFWIVSGVASTLVVTLIVSDLISWDKLNQDFVASSELSRAFLASFILVLDLVIMMQDWDFPHFTTTVHINLPGFSVAKLEWKYAEVNLTGKWFSYGVIFMVMMLDLNMWKNQIFYTPDKFGQYTGPDYKIYTVSDVAILQTGNSTLWTWQERSKIDEKTKQPYYHHDMKMNTTFMHYPLYVKCLAFIPSMVALSIYLWLIYHYGRFPHKKDKMDAKNDEDTERVVTEEGIIV